jgi:AcrR family transcriptional regulator
VEQRRNIIVQATITELRENAFARIKVESVAKRAGLDKRTLYDYIGRKEDLLLLVFGHFLPPMLDAVRAARDIELEPLRQLRSMLSVHCEIITKNPHFVLFLYRELRYLPASDQQNVLGLINDIRSEYVRVFSIIDTVGHSLRTRDSALNASSALTMIDMIGLHRHALGERDSETVAAHIMRTLVGVTA